MDESRFDALTLEVATGLDRRKLGGLFAVIGLGAAALSPRTPAKNKHKHKKRKKKRCKKNEDRCGKSRSKCVKSCPASSDSMCCDGAFTQCCPSGTLTDHLCCQEGQSCCPPRDDVPEFPQGYCCDPGFACGLTGEDPCLAIAMRSKASTTASSSGPSAPGTVDDVAP